MPEDLKSNNNQLKSPDQSNGSGRGGGALNKLIYLMCFSVIVFVGTSFISCNFSIPGTLQYKWAKGELKNEPKIDCAKSQNDGLTQLLVAAGLLIAYKAKAEE
jgi:hypothetical protein